MKRLSFIALLLLPLYAQQKLPVTSEQEDCGVTFNFNTASSGAQAAGTTQAGSTGTTAVIDNRQAACVYWKVAYTPNSVTASVSLAFQTADDVAGVPGTWTNYPGSLDSGINPNTAVTTGGARTEASGVEYPFLRMNMTVLTGAGARIQGKLTGWKSRPPITANAVIVPGTICTAGVPCPVDGPTAAGSPPIFPPVMVSGQDGTNIRTILTDTSGRTRAVGAAADGAAVVGDPVRIGGKDGSGNTQDVATDTSGNVQVVGTKTNNAAPPGTNNVGTLPAVATAAAPSYTEGDQVANSTDLAGNIRVIVAAGSTCTTGSPCVVDGPTANGSPPTTPPLFMAGWDLTNIRSLLTDSVGQLRVIPAPTAVTPADGIGNAAMPTVGVGVTPTYFETVPYVFNGSTWDRQFICPNRVMVTLTDATLTALVAVSGTTVVRVCHAHATTSGVAETFNLVQGTGVACAGATTTIDSYVTVSGFSTDYTPAAALRTSASNGLCVSQSGAAQTGVVWISYAQF